MERIFKQSVFPFLNFDSNVAFRVSDASLQLHNARILSIMVQLNCPQLPIQLLVVALLSAVGSFEICATLVLFIQAGVLALHDVHLQDCANCVLFRSSDAHLLPVVLELRDHVVEDFLQVVKMPAHSELFPSLVAAEKSVVSPE